MEQFIDAPDQAPYQEYFGVRSDGQPARVVVLGSTGSIGLQTLDVARRHPDKIAIVGIAAQNSVQALRDQAHEFKVSHVAVGNSELAGRLAEDNIITSVAYGPDAVSALAESEDADIVINALVGAAGVRASYAALRAGKRLALANKESLVVAGDILMPLSKEMEYRHGKRAALVPIDSEHGAIYQCLIGERPSEVTRLWVTASGGPFRGCSKEDLQDITPERALAHPTWKMGPKITIDSSTLMNKGLEVIEAHHLFDMPYDRISVVVQPQSAIHSMVEFSDGSVKAHLGTTDMRIPIQYALSYPDRWNAPVAPLDFTQLGSLAFEAPDTETFPCLALAYKAGNIGGTMPAVMNAANEVAVAAFLKGEDTVCYTDIAACVEAVMDLHAAGEGNPGPAKSIDQLLEVDAWARKEASEWLADR